MFEFKTTTGNTYAWDDDTGMCIPFSQALKAVINEVSSQKSFTRENVIEKLKNDFGEEEVAYFYDWIKKWNRLAQQNDNLIDPRTFSASNVKNYVLRYGLKQLTLNVTDDCNFRCKYCGYSDYYEYTRSYSKKYMNFDIAKKAIDQYYSLLEEGRRYNPWRESGLGFYGGEPLLNFNLIKKCVEYIEDRYGHHGLRYYMTTNGSLLNKDKSDWLMQHGFSISVSLDGPEKEHDRNRIYSDGKGTFRDVLKNISRLMDSGHRVTCSGVFDWKSDLFKINEFFARKDIPHLSQASIVYNKGGCTYFDQFSKEERNSFEKQLKKAMLCYIKDLSYKMQHEEKSLFDTLFDKMIQSVFSMPISVSSSPKILPSTSACMPGKKLFVDVDGNFHICERVPGAIHIGNVDEGLNFKKIGEILSDYFQHMDKCASCAVGRICLHCYADFATDKEFLCSSTVCKGVEAARAESFSNALIIAEMNPKIVEQPNIYNKLMKYYG